jgi:hypothetical protein
MNSQISTDVLGNIVSFLDITEDRNVLTVFKQICKISDKEKDHILRIWENNSKHECKEEKEKTTWLVNGKIHRDNDLPAIEWIDGSKSWYINGKLHREDNKPAVEHSDGWKYWWVDGHFIK